MMIVVLSHWSFDYCCYNQVCMTHAADVNHLRSHFVGVMFFFIFLSLILCWWANVGQMQTTVMTQMNATLFPSKVA